MSTRQNISRSQFLNSVLSRLGRTLFERKAHWGVAGILLFVLCGSFSISPVKAAEGNIAADPSFENGVIGWCGYPTFPIIRTMSKARTGRYSMPMPQGENDDPRWKNHWMTSGMSTIPYAVEGGATYRCVIHALVDEGSDKPVKVIMYPGTFLYQYPPGIRVEKIIPKDGQWHPIELEFVNPDYAELLVVGVHAEGEMYLDDFEIVKIKPPPPTPANLKVEVPTYHRRGAVAKIACTVTNTTGEKVELSVAANVKGLDMPSPAIVPIKGYGPILRQWDGQILSLNPGESRNLAFEFDTKGLDDCGLMFEASAQVQGKEVSKASKEFFICERPDWRKWFSVGAQCYTSNRMDGTWIRDLKDRGGDSVREGVPLPLSYRNAIPGQWTDYPLDERLNYYARLGLKWLSALHTIMNNAPAWLSEDPACRRTRYGGKIMERPSVCYFAGKSRRALMDDAERSGRIFQECPVVFGVQVDNEINAMDCYCESAQGSFRNFMENEFGSVDKLNVAAGTSYK
ncbi:MAG: beta-galactosidase, partial [Victivallales bacterium]